VAAEDEFAPYVGGLADLMQKLMILKEESLFSLRGRALECMGHMAIAVGKEGFQPYFLPTMQCALEGLAMDSTDLHEFAYAVFANLAKVMGEDFAPALTDLVPHLLQVIGSDEGQVEAVRSEEVRVCVEMYESICFVPCVSFSSCATAFCLCTFLRVLALSMLSTTRMTKMAMTETM
jgi:hypothetical protein